MKKVMDKLEIDSGARPLFRQMLKHGYKTRHICEGHKKGILGKKFGAYVTFDKNTGDGWFEEHAGDYGLKRDNRISFREELFGDKVETYRGDSILHPEETKYINYSQDIKQKGLLKKLFSIIVIIGLGGAVFFLLPNFTGNTITNLIARNSSIIGVGLFFIGFLVCLFLIYRKNNF